MTPAMLQAAIGKAIRSRRLACGLSQGQLARKLRSYRPIVARIEAGRHSLNVETLIRFAEALSCSPSDVLADAERIALAALGETSPSLAS